MASISHWTNEETQILIDNYLTKTIYELSEILPGKSDDAINSKVKKLKKLGKIVGVKTEATIRRAYAQRTERE